MEMINFKTLILFVFLLGLYILISLPIAYIYIKALYKGIFEKEEKRDEEYLKLLEKTLKKKVEYALKEKVRK